MVLIGLPLEGCSRHYRQQADGGSLPLRPGPVYHVVPAKASRVNFLNRL
jgi:hypothetical protein